MTTTNNPTTPPHVPSPAQLERAARMNLEAARLAKYTADLRVAVTRGSLVAAVESVPVADMPGPVRAALIRYHTAVERQAERTEELKCAIARAPKPGSDDVARKAKLSALVARHIAGAELVENDDPVFRWRLERPDGKLVSVPNYATDRCAMLQAIEKRLSIADRNLMASHILAGAGGSARAAGMTETAAAVFASAEQLARAALCTIGIDADAAEPLPVLPLAD